MAPLDVNTSYPSDWYTLQQIRTGVVETPPAIEELPPIGGVSTATNFFIPNHNVPSVEGGSRGYYGPELKGGVCAANFLETA